MRIATFQFAPTLGEVNANRDKVRQLLDRAEERGELDGLDLLVFPEMALSGECTLSSSFQIYIPILSFSPTRPYELRGCGRLQFPLQRSNPPVS
jgi:predicted amidohydrolase